MSTMRAMVVKEQGGGFELEERKIPAPGPDEVLIKVHACGVCHSDVFARRGLPRHELAGYPGP